jgi:hypothetical protein
VAELLLSSPESLSLFETPPVLLSHGAAPHRRHVHVQRRNDERRRKPISFSYCTCLFINFENL